MTANKEIFACTTLRQTGILRMDECLEKRRPVRRMACPTELKLTSAAICLSPALKEFGCGMHRATILERLKCPSNRPIWLGETRTTTRCTSQARPRSIVSGPKFVGLCLLCHISGDDPGPNCAGCFFCFANFVKKVTLVGAHLAPCMGPLKTSRASHLPGSRRWPGGPSRPAFLKQMDVRELLALRR